MTDPLPAGAPSPGAATPEVADINAERIAPDLAAPGPLILGPLLRYVDETSATLWMEFDRPGTVEVLGSSTSTFTVRGRSYALVVIENLDPGTTTSYEVRFDQQLVWPEPIPEGAEVSFPPSVIRTSSPDRDVAIVVGSCRASAPHVVPFTLERAFDHEGRGVDSLWASAMALAEAPTEELPDLLLFVGDQIYADDSSPRTRERIDTVRAHDPASIDLDPAIVASFEEYAWLYHEAWSSPYERWLLSTVPSAMIFDDHDMIDDWNISEAWVTDIRTEPWWQRHVIGGLTSYLIYQHLGNLSPAQLREQGWLERLPALADATEELERWALDSEAATPLPGGYRFSFRRDVGDVTVVVIDTRNARVLDEGRRRMVGDDEWAWIEAEAHSARRHLVLATTLPVFVGAGLHDLQVWNEQVCAGRWGRRAAAVGERVRRHLDLEHWAAFGESYRAFCRLLTELGRHGQLESIVVAAGDIHFSYAARVEVVEAAGGPPVWQVVSSPMRNALIPFERGVLRASLTKAGRAAGAALRASVRSGPPPPGIEPATGPHFANNLCTLHYDPSGVNLEIDHYEATTDGRPDQERVAQVQIAGRPA